MNQSINLEFNATIPLSDKDSINFEYLDKKSQNARKWQRKNAGFFNRGSPVLTWISSTPQSYKFMAYAHKKKRVAVFICAPSYAYKKYVKLLDNHWIWT